MGVMDYLRKRKIEKKRAARKKAVKNAAIGAGLGAAPFTTALLAPTVSFISFPLYFAVTVLVASFQSTV